MTSAIESTLIAKDEFLSVIGNRLRTEIELFPVVSFHILCFLRRSRQIPALGKLAWIDGTLQRNGIHH